jgi:hypothetical protein
MANPYWWDESEAMVKESMSQAIQAKRAGYNDSINELGAFLDGNHEDVSKKSMETYYEALYADSDRAATVRPEYIPLVPFLVRKLASWLAKDPIVWLTKPDGSLVRSDESDAINMQSLLNDTNLSDYWWKGEQYRAAFWTMFWQVGYREEEITFDIFRPSWLEIHESISDPRRFDWARVVTIPAYVPNWSPSSDTETSAYATDTYYSWSRYRDTQGLHWGFHLTDRAGVQKESQVPPVFPDGINKYGMFPVVRWNEWPATDGVFVDMDDTLLQAGKNADMIFTDMGEIIGYDSFGTKCLLGMNAENTLETPSSPRAVWRIGDADKGGDFKIVGPKAKIDSVLNYINQWLRYQAVHRDLPSNLYDLDTPNIQTGAAVVAGKIDLNDARENRREGMRRDIGRLLHTARRVNNVHVPKRHIDESYIIHVAFEGEQEQDAAAEQAEAQARQFEYASGKRSVVDDYLREVMKVDPRQALPEQRKEAFSKVLANAGEWAAVQNALPPAEFREKKKAEEDGDEIPDTSEG